MDNVVIVSATRTALGGFQGAISGLSAPQLGAVTLSSALTQSGVNAQEVDQVFMGCVLTAGVGQAPARQAAINANLPFSVPCTTINKVCGSGMQAVILAHDVLMTGSSKVILAGGMESMSQAPYLLPKARSGYRLGHGKLLDHMFMDGLEDSYSNEYHGRLMGTFAEDTAKTYGFTRSAQDEFAIRSTTRAQQAISSGKFKWEITPTTTLRGDIIDTDEQPLKAKLEKIPLLKPAFIQDGTVTAANSSSISDGAAALMLMRQSTAEKMGISPLAKLVGHSIYAGAPHLFPIAPIHAMEKLFEKTGWIADKIDLFEINEAFAVVTMAAMHTLKLPHEKVNLHGGACALGHPIGSSGARIIVTLLGALQSTGGKRGVASLCIGGGEATAIAIEMM